MYVTLHMFFWIIIHNLDYHCCIEFFFKHLGLLVLVDALLTYLNLTQLKLVVIVIEMNTSPRY